MSKIFGKNKLKLASIIIVTIMVLGTVILLGSKINASFIDDIPTKNGQHTTGSLAYAISNDRSGFLSESASNIFNVSNIVASGYNDISDIRYNTATCLYHRQSTIDGATMKIVNIIDINKSGTGKIDVYKYDGSHVQINDSADKIGTQMAYLIYQANATASGVSNNENKLKSTIYNVWHQWGFKNLINDTGILCSDFYNGTTANTFGSGNYNETEKANAQAIANSTGTSAAVSLSKVDTGEVSAIYQDGNTYVGPLKINYDGNTTLITVEGKSATWATKDTSGNFHIQSGKITSGMQFYAVVQNQSVYNDSGVHVKVQVSNSEYSARIALLYNPAATGQQLMYFAADGGSDSKEVEWVTETPPPPGGDPFDSAVTISGYVWEDQEDGKNREYNSLYGSEDRKVSGVPVKLYKGGTVVSTVVTDSYGGYSFGIDPSEAIQEIIVGDKVTYKFTTDMLNSFLSQYHMEFTYDGFTYTTVPQINTVLSGSKGAEDGTTRRNVNSQYSKVTNATEASNFDNTVIANIYNIQNYEDSNAYIEKDISENVLSATFTDINLGIRKREQPTMALKEDIDSVLVTLNKYQYRYDYATRMKYYNNTSGVNAGVKFENKDTQLYTRTVYASDIDAAIEGRANLGVDVIYVIRIENNSTTLPMSIGSLVNYYDVNYDEIKAWGFTRDEVLKDQNLQQHTHTGSPETGGGCYIQVSGGTRLCGTASEQTGPCSWWWDDENNRCIRCHSTSKTTTHTDHYCNSCGSSCDEDGHYVQESPRYELNCGQSNGISNGVVPGTITLTQSGAAFKRCDMDFGIGNIMIEPQGHKDIYIRYKVNQNFVLDLINNEKEPLKNISEITSYATYYGESTYRGPGDGCATKELYAALDVDSKPSTFYVDLETGSYTFTQEALQDDADIGPRFKLVLGKERSISGQVFEDVDANNNDNERLGNGIIDSDENVVAGVMVKLLELDDNGNVKKDENGNDVIAKYSNGELVIDYTDKYGLYKFGYIDEVANKYVGILPGKYVIQFEYTSDSTINTKSGEVIKAIGEDLNEYKSTIVTSDVIQQALTSEENISYSGTTYQNDKWYVIAEPNRYSDAIDDLEQRKYGNPTVVNNTTIEHIKYGKTTAIAYTSNMNIGIEHTSLDSHIAMWYDEKGNLKGQTFLNEYPNIDFGIIQKPINNIEVSKVISYMMLKNNNQEVLVEGNPSDINSKLYNVKSGLDGIVPAEFKPEELHGATLELEYTISVKNTSQDDYDSDAYYYFGVKSGNKKTVTIYKMVDYLDSTIVYNEDKNKDTWKLTTIDELRTTEEMKDKYISEGVYELLKDHKEEYTIAMSKSSELSNIEVGKTKSIRLYASKVLANTEEITIDNATEVIEIAGDRPILNATPGNYNPKTKSVDEQDNDDVRIAITPPTGVNMNIMTYILTVTGSLLLIIVGIIIIKKKIINRY